MYRFGPQSTVLLRPGIGRNGEIRKKIFVVFQAMGELYLSISSLFSASSAGVLSPQKKSPPTTMLLPASPAKAPETEPIDVAAHLQLLGESLSLIGHRLQETEVSGTISIAPVSDTMWICLLLPRAPSEQLLLFCARLCQALRTEWQDTSSWKHLEIRNLLAVKVYPYPILLNNGTKRSEVFYDFFPQFLLRYNWSIILYFDFLKMQWKKWIQIPWKFWSLVLLREFQFFCTIPVRS